ncbi:hypothetical protein I551_8933, partial [Mycobacterium ulcerans str. Harvey]
AARRLKVGDKVYFRHTKAGELCERFDRLYLVRGAQVVDVVPTYRVRDAHFSKEPIAFGAGKGCLAYELRDKELQ